MNPRPAHPCGSTMGYPGLPRAGGDRPEGTWLSASPSPGRAARAANPRRTCWGHGPTGTTSALRVGHRRKRQQDPGPVPAAKPNQAVQSRCRFLPPQDIYADAQSFLKPCPLLARAFIQIRAAIKTNDCGRFDAFLLVKSDADALLHVQLAVEVPSCSSHRELIVCTWDLCRAPIVDKILLKALGTLISCNTGLQTLVLHR